MSSSRWLIRSCCRLRVATARTCKLPHVTKAPFGTQSPNMSSASTTTSTTTTSLPLTHSRKQLPPACIDPVELHDVTAQLLETTVGNLIPFQPSTTTSTSTTSLDDRQWAWRQADATCQLVEYLLRGHSARLPHTLWNTWTNTTSHSSEADAAAIVATMEALLDRMWDEGHFYMTVRKGHLSQVAWEQQQQQQHDNNDDNNDDDDDVWTDEQDDVHADSVIEEHSPTAGVPGTQSASDNYADFNHNHHQAGQDHDELDLDHDSDDDDDDDDPMEDFASPGPTVNMYDVFLDTLAVAALNNNHNDNNNHSIELLQDPLRIFEILQVIIYRHQLDGGDEFNANPHTLPTQMSMNATLRTVANLSWDEQQQPPSKFRDSALICAMGTYDAYTHLQLEQNPSTYVYMLQILCKYIPASRSRGHLAQAMWHSATEQGLVTQAVVHAFLEVHHPGSNGPEFETFLDAHVRTKDDDQRAWTDRFPHAHRRRNQSSRHLARQDYY